MTDWLLGTLLATSGLIVLVLMIREPVRRNFGARVAYGLWLIPAARLLMPTLTQTIERPVGSAVSPQMFSSQTMAEPLLLSSVAQTEPSLIEQAGGWPTILMVLWLGVAAGLFAARILAFRSERAAILESATDLGRIGSIRLIQTREVSGPLAFGILDRVIAVSADFELIYAEHERRLALEHEVAHHRSGDLVANLFAFTLLCLQWFNPIAWIAHAAFRFDQEAACDARVLETVGASDPSDYGRAIAKATSGRALLFASALERRNTLHRRLKSMLSIPTAGRRMTGRMMVLAGIALALPLTATRAIQYIDVPMLQASAPAAPKSSGVAPAAPVAAVAQVAAPAPVAPVASNHHSNLNIDEAGMVTINGRTRQWKDLSPAEKAEVRRSLAEARAELSKINQEEIQREVREAMNEAKINSEDMRREMAEARVEVDQAMREIDSHSAELRRSGQDPEQLKATVRASLKAVEAIDVEAITRQAMASVDPATINAAMAAAQAGLAKAEAELERAEEMSEPNND
ncbi:MAG TPA: M56 family metallopeptidase [Sphingomicrobium sp.]|nr:M56 family metallopeptidase [Sphingomicrobium sp.]